mgnify:CR=1 FL=1
MKRCDELERKLRYFNTETEKFGLESKSAGRIDDFLEESVGTSKADPTSSLEAMENELDGYESQLKELNSYNDKLTHEFNEKVEYQEVLEKTLSSKCSGWEGKEATPPCLKVTQAQASFGETPGETNLVLAQQHAMGEDEEKAKDAQQYIVQSKQTRDTQTTVVRDRQTF